jgi:molybdopterin-guanine dinucleotide biosynthesis protein A
VCDLTIVILAGGRATRLPGKLMLRVGNEPMLARVLHNMQKTGFPCVLSVREPLRGQPELGGAGRVIYDEYDDAGPLGGLASAAARIATPLLFAAAADLPNLDGAALEALLRLRKVHEARTGRAPQGLVPRHADGRIEPLAALYDTKALALAARRMLARGRKKVSDALSELDLAYYAVPAAEAERYLNVNTPADLAKITAV